MYTLQYDCTAPKLCVKKGAMASVCARERELAGGSGTAASLCAADFCFHQARDAQKLNTLAHVHMCREFVALQNIAWLCLRLQLLLSRHCLDQCLASAAAHCSKTRALSLTSYDIIDFDAVCLDIKSAQYCSNIARYIALFS